MINGFVFKVPLASSWFCFDGIRLTCEVPAPVSPQSQTSPESFPSTCDAHLKAGLIARLSRGGRAGAAWPRKALCSWKSLWYLVTYSAAAGSEDFVMALFSARNAPFSKGKGWLGVVTTFPPAEQKMVNDTL